MKEIWNKMHDASMDGRFGTNVPCFFEMLLQKSILLEIAGKREFRRKQIDQFTKYSQRKM